MHVDFLMLQWISEIFESCFVFKYLGVRSLCFKWF